MVATSASGSISFDGLASGLKTNEIVDAMVEAQKAPVRQLDRREEVLKAHKAAYAEVATLAGALDEAAKNMAVASSFVTYAARSSNEDVLKVSAGAGARAGLYAIDVKQLATGQRSFSATQPSDTEPSDLAAGRISWSVDGEAFGIEVEAHDSLSDIADRINDLAGRISATLLFDGDAYRLQLTGTLVGRKNAVVFDTDTTGLRLDDPDLLVQPAQDATLVLDGVTTIRRSDNVINDVLKGLTFSLEDEGDKVRVKVTQDLDAMAEQIEKFTERYNEVVRAVSGHLRYEGKHDPKKMSGDSTFSNLLRGLQQAVTRPVSGATSAINAFSMIGITTSKEGTLSLDQARLKEVITSSPQAVEKLVGNDRRSGSTGVGQRVSEEIKRYMGTGVGQVHGKNKSIETQMEAIARRKQQMEVHSERYEASLRKQFADLERNMSKLKSQNSFLEGQANNRNNK